MNQVPLRQSIIDNCLRMNEIGLNQGVAGNISVRDGDVMLITPTSVPYDELRPEDIVEMPLDGEYGAWSGPKPPSSEWRFHLDIMRSRPDVQAIVHSHPMYCTSIAITRRAIPACHYMIAAFGGKDVRCADYATYGTSELSENVLVAMRGRTACLLANHGSICVGRSLSDAMWRAVELETIAQQYFNAMLMGNVAILSDEQIETVRRKGFSESYGGMDGPAPE
ncbi:MAG: class II aldolase/adducin family protein [Tropicimonas sp.]|uniref:class II aldolase/adducin family protein n=1 Tax=Tropicimonas sp. TaxID=2067044 RepID=UPI003A84103A